MNRYLLSVLACPEEDHGDLEFDAAARLLTCTLCHRQFGVVDGIPVLLACGSGPEMNIL